MKAAAPARLASNYKSDHELEPHCISGCVGVVCGKCVEKKLKNPPFQILDLPLQLDEVLAFVVNLMVTFFRFCGIPV